MAFIIKDVQPPPVHARTGPSALLHRICRQRRYRYSVADHDFDAWYRDVMIDDRVSAERGAL